MASDGEITAMRAAGVSSRRVIAPVLVFAAIGAGLAGYASLRLTPFAIRESTRIIKRSAGHATLRGNSAARFRTRISPTPSSTWAMCGPAR